MEDCASFAAQLTVLLTSPIEVLSRKAAHPLVGEDALAWSELFSLEDSFVLWILGANIALNGSSFHASNCTGTTTGRFHAFGGGNDAMDALNVEVFEDPNQMLKANVIEFAMELVQEFLSSGQVGIIVITDTGVGQFSHDLVDAVEAMKKRHSCD